MYKLILLAVSTGTFLLANMNSEFDASTKSSNTNDYYWEEGSDNLQSDAGRRRGKGPRGRRRGGSGLR
tara:strand:- start:3565 stop:3768 length:204 start_codon:yes stop_codon:yes gene_type:complete